MSDGRSLQFGGEWTRQKLDVVSGYLRSYLIALKRQSFRLAYVDAFAGTGYCGRKAALNSDPPPLPELADEETQSFLKGSTRRALEIEPGFDRYIFIDRDPGKCAQLERLQEEFPEKAGRIELVKADANVYLQEACRAWPQDQRAVLFLDPYGMEVRWDTVRAVARTAAVDMWYLFNLSGVNRLLRRDAMIGPKERALLNGLFGTPEWEQAFYRERETPTLFGEDTGIQKTANFPAIQQFLVERLGSEFAGVSRSPGILRNSRNSPLFLLCFAAANPKGATIVLRIAGHLLRGI